MRHATPTSRRPASRAAARLAACALLLALTAGLARAQTQSATSGTTPSGAEPGSPAGSYALSGFDTVNPYNGGLNFRLPLLTVSGRGEARVALGLRIEQRWTAHKEQNPGQNATFWAEPSWWSDEGGGQNPLGAGRVQVRKAASRETPISNGCNGFVVRRSLTRLTFTAPDGTEYEMVDAATGGQPYVVPTPPQCSTGFNRGRVFVTKDGSAATFISDADVIDAYYYEQQGAYEVSGQVLFADGTRYGVRGGDVKWLRDRNGNLMTFAHDTYGRLTEATDSLGRKVTVVYAAGTTTYDEIRFSGFGGAARTIRINHVNLGAALRAGFTLTTAQFPELNSGVYNPKVVDYLELPDGRRYNFRYNNYAELARVELPTGGAVEYDHAAGLTGGAASGVFNLWNGTSTDRHIYRRVVERRVYPGGGTGADYAAKTTYGRPESAAANLGYVDEDVCTSGPAAGECGAGAALLGRTRHHYYGSPRASFGIDPTAYRGYREGREYQTEVFDADGETVLRRVEQTWQQPAAGQTWPLGQAEADEAARPNDPQVTQTLTTLADVTPSLQSKQTYAYDQYSNRTDSYEYDYGAGAPGALVRRTHTDYVTAATYVDANTDPSAGAHLRRLPSLAWVSSDAAGNSKLSRTAYEYDNYTPDARHAALLSRSSITGLCLTLDAAGACVKASDVNFHLRGNVTGVTSYADAAGAAGPVTVSTQYDMAGNPVKSIDAMGRLSSVGYADSFSNPASGAGAYKPHTYAFQTSTTSPVPDPANNYGSSTALTIGTKYDFWTGLVSSTTDANGRVTAVEYDAADELDRPKAVVRPDGGRTDYQYGDTPGNLYVRTQTDLDAARRTDSYRYFDRLGRPVRAINYENQDAAKPWVTVDTEYDALGRVKRASLPYRAAGGADMFFTDKWTESIYDALGRMTAVTTRPDGAVVTTSYSGNQVTVTDQALKKRRSVTDALGRLVRADEPNASGALDVSGTPAQPTYYTYDAAGNLRKVTQGTQTRFFMYDSLGRLTRAKNPEQAFNANITGTDPVTGHLQWSLSYSYDLAGNLLTRTDARGVTTTYTYDALNRNTTADYSDTTINPDVKRTYDGAAFGKGRVWHSYSGGDETTGTAVHDTAVDSYDEVGRPLARRQRFKTGNSWADYEVRHTYDKAGNVLTQTYPSGRTATYTYDRMGRPSTFSGNLGDSVQRTYADTTLYDELGGRSQERFGTQTPLYSKRFHNERGQLSEVRVGTKSITSDDPTHWNRGAILNVYSAYPIGWTGSGPDNNGNLRKQMVFVPNGENPTGGDGWWETALYYEYDALNRLDYVREERGGADLWKQDYDYDRWGNRTVNAANTQVYGTSPTYSIPEPQFDTGNLQYSNRLYAPGDLTLPAASRKMAYDEAGNLIRDTHTGQGTRTYDAENRMTSAQFLSGQVQTAVYTYDADGRRVKRHMDAGGEVWQVYGVGGELLAEYAAGASHTLPQVEYGYRAGELLVRAAAPVGQAPAAANTASFVRSDTTTQGNWKNVYGVDGYNVIGDSASYPSYAQVSVSGHTAHTWAASTSDARALRKAASATDRVAACWYSATSFTVDVNLTDGRAHRVALYNLDWSGTATRAQRVEVLDGTTGAVLDTRDLTAFRDPGVYLVWHVSGRVKFKVTYTGATAWNAVISGLFFDPAEQTAALFEGEDAATGGDWKGAYGADGYNVINNAASYPAYAQVSASGQLSHTWAASTTEARALQKASGTDRIAATWYSATNFTIDVNLTDGQEHRVALYCLDWGNNSRSQRVEVLDAATNAVLDSRNVSSFVNGKYITWRLKGHVKLRVVNLNAATNAAVSGLFFGGGAGGADVRWMVSDHLGNPRMVVDQTGSLSGVTRHDYLPFGEELAAGAAGRTAGWGYGGDGVRQKFTGKERDGETGLDYFISRYYSSTLGRFASPDSLYITATRPHDPQQFNLYSYVRNNPLMFVDPDGRDLKASSGTEAGALIEEDRRRLEIQLRRLAPGTRVDADGKVHKAGLFRRIWNHLSGHGAGQALVTSLADAKLTTNIVVTDSGNSGSRPRLRVVETPFDAVVTWNYTQTTSGLGEVMVRLDGTANGPVTSELVNDPALVLGHELIHANHIVHGTQSLDNDATHNFVATIGGVTNSYQEGNRSGTPNEEFRTVGFHPYARRGDVTENRLRKELGLRPRVSYYPYDTWICTSCGP